MELNECVCVTAAMGVRVSEVDCVFSCFSFTLHWPCNLSTSSITPQHDICSNYNNSSLIRPVIYSEIRQFQKTQNHWKHDRYQSPDILSESGETSGSESDPLPAFISPSWVGEFNCRLLLWSIWSQAVSVCIQHQQQNLSALCWITWPALLLLLLLLLTVCVQKTLFPSPTLGEIILISGHIALNREFKQSAADAETYSSP